MCFCAHAAHPTALRVTWVAQQLREPGSLSSSDSTGARAGVRNLLAWGSGLCLRRRPTTIRSKSLNALRCSTISANERVDCGSGGFTHPSELYGFGLDPPTNYRRNGSTVAKRWLGTSARRLCCATASSRECRPVLDQCGSRTPAGVGEIGRGHAPSSPKYRRSMLRPRHARADACKHAHHSCPAMRQPRSTLMCCNRSESGAYLLISQGR